MTHTRRAGRRAGLTAVITVVAAALVSAQAVIQAPPNKYTPAQDVELGQKAAAQVEQQLPIMRDEQVTGYVRTIGRRLVDAIPPELRHPEFRYTFQVVNVREINAFALPGGAMFVNRGMIETARDEGEIAGVMAHELSHVALRHGTAQQTKATPYAIGEIAGAVLGAIVGGGLGNVIAQGTQFGIGTAFLRFSREFEKEADLEGSHIMARAGYDPRDMANVFKTIEKQSGSGGPQWLSDHPNPGNRYEYLTREAELLHVTNPIHDTRGFDEVRAYLKRLPRAPTTEEATKAGAGRRTADASGPPPDPSRVEPPSREFRTYDEGGMLRVTVPANWRELPGNNSVTFAPEGAYGAANGQNVFTHGVQIGIARNETHDLETATSELLNSLASGNPRLGRPSRYTRASVAGRDGLEATVSNVSEATGRPEIVEVFTTLMRDGNLLYAIGVAPQEAFDEYRNTFRRIAGSLQMVN